MILAGTVEGAWNVDCMRINIPETGSAPEQVFKSGESKKLQCSPAYDSFRSTRSSAPGCLGGAGFALESSGKVFKYSRRRRDGKASELHRRSQRKMRASRPMGKYQRSIRPRS